MFLNVVKHNIFETGCSYSCFHLRWNRLRFVNGNIGDISKFCSQSSLLRRAVTVNIAPSGILSNVKSGFNPCLKYCVNKAVSVPYGDETKRSYSQDEMGALLDDRVKVNNVILECEDIMKSNLRSKERMAKLIQMMNFKNYRVEIQQLVKILYYVIVLGIRDEEVLLRLSNDIISSLHKFTGPGSLVMSYITSLRIALIRDTEALDKLLTWLCSKDISLNIMVSTILTLAYLDYFPHKGEIILQRIGRREIDEFLSKRDYFEFIWSLVLLDRAEEDIIQDVLNYEFWKKLEHSMLKGKEGNFMKIMNIYAYADIRKFQISPDMKWVENNPAWIVKAKSLKSSSRDSQQILNVVTHLFPLNTYSFYVFSNCGLIIDAVCYLDDNCRPITESRYTVEERSIKFAILSTSFYNYCFPGKIIPTGILKFYKAHLERSGYKTLFLPYNFFPISSSLEEKCKQLKKRIRNVLPDFDNCQQSNNCDKPQKGRVV